MELLHKITKAYSLRKKEVTRYKLQAFRLIHGVADGFPGLTIEVYPQAFHGIIKEKQYFKQIPFFESALKNIAQELWQNDTVDFYWWDYSGRQVRAIHKLPLQRYEIFENNLKYEIHLGEDNHTGLFLDQRNNRRLIQSLASDKKVLNLFCYTGSFSIAALAGGASNAVSVDLSKKTLEWAKRNIILNNLDLNRSQLIAFDAVSCLKRLEKKNELFDLIICDPPTFSRSKNGFFSMEKNLEDLLGACLSILSSKGKLLFSLNAQKMNFRDFSLRVENVLREEKLQKPTYLGPSFDFPLYQKEPHLKACLIGK
ncbi:MAG: class I SAM-dependent rRNA methyltransferase [Deltaproteobacteria bacterium]|nr:class I SAM-dependent rRNA methyltransferase [Deltaproteobacteria bacterium]